MNNMIKHFKEKKMKMNEITPIIDNILNNKTILFNKAIYKTVITAWLASRAIKYLLNNRGNIVSSIANSFKTPKTPMRNYMPFFGTQNTSVSSAPINYDKAIYDSYTSPEAYMYSF